MAESPLGRIGARRISAAQFAAAPGTNSRSKRTRTFEPIGTGSPVFTRETIQNIIPPSNARAFKVVRMMGGKYTRPDNPLGLGTEGPFSMSDWDAISSDLFGDSDLDITKVIFDVS